MIRPLPIGYVEIQRAWVGRQSAAYVDAVIGEARAAAERTHPGMLQHGARIETVTDGRGVDHYTLYMGFAPKHSTTPPLDPRNLNAAPERQIGDGVEDFSIGMKERKF